MKKRRDPIHRMTVFLSAIGATLSLSLMVDGYAMQSRQAGEQPRTIPRSALGAVRSLASPLLHHFVREDGFMRSIALAFLLSCTISTAHSADVTRMTITGDDGRQVVPEGQVWKIERLHPYQTEKGVGTADLSLEGGVQMGDNRELNVYGTFDLTLSGPQQVPLWILAGSKVAVGDSRGSVPIEVLGSTAATAAAPDEVMEYVAERDLCEHFRGEPAEGNEPDQIERREFLRQSVEIYCAGTDRRLAALKQRYLADAAAMSLLERYETSSEGI